MFFAMLVVSALTACTNGTTEEVVSTVDTESVIDSVYNESVDTLAIDTPAVAE